MLEGLNLGIGTIIFVVDKSSIDIMSLFVEKNLIRTIMKTADDSSGSYL